MQNKNNLIVIVLSNLVALAAIVWVAVSSYGLSAENLELKRKHFEQIDKINNVAGLKNLSPYIVRATTILPNHFVSKDGEIAVIDNFDTLAKQAGVEYTLNNASNEGYVVLDISVSGQFRNIYYFMKLVENSGYAISYSKFSAFRSDKEWSSNMIINIPKLAK